MSLIRSRLLNRNIKNGFVNSIRLSSENSDDSLIEAATNKEKRQLFQKHVGQMDPFKLRAIKRTASSKGSPNLIPSYYDCRIVGCVCEEDSSSINWMWLFKGEPKKCYCGHWFQLTEYEPYLK